MSGHSKWATIKHKKGAADAKRGRIFTRLIKEITIAARMGGGNPEFNPRLRSAIVEAKANNMPSSNIERATKKGTGELEGTVIEEATYEGYGPGGVAVMVETITDSRNRTASEMRKLFSKHGGNMGEVGCVGWMFQTKGVILVEKKPGVTEDKLMEVALDAGVQDIQDADESFELTCDSGALPAVKEALDKAKVSYLSAKVDKVPQNTVRVTGKDAEQVIKLAEALEDHDDVQNVFANFDIDPSELPPAE
jgi:YebC/PmpR family DNA-binding regulatory protein